LEKGSQIFQAAQTMQDDCATGSGDEHSCFNRKALVELATQWNRRRPDDPVDTSLGRHELLVEMRRRMMSICKDREACWVDVLPAPTALTQIKPIAPHHTPYSWLRTNDITETVTRFCKDARIHHAFLGVFPIDFAAHDNLGRCVSNLMCSLDVRKIASPHFSAVFNTDSHTKPGAHWICSFSHIDPAHPDYGFNFYDSYGDRPPKEVRELAHAVAAKIKVDRPFPLRYNKHVHQRRPGQCGMFCIAFLMAMASGIGFDEYCASPHVRDAAMAEMRKQVFVLPTWRSRSNLA
jgi:hypothetical protein